MDLEALVQNIKSRCKLKGVPPTVACKESGVGTNFITAINKGSTPSVAKVQQMATYLGCTVSDLLGEKKEPTTVPGDELFHDDVLDILKQFPPETMLEVERYIRFRAEQKEKP